MTRNPAGTQEELRVNGHPVGTIRQVGNRRTLQAGSTLASVERSDQPLFPDRPYPRRIVVEGRLDDEPAARQEYVLLAPAAPIRIEGLGLQISMDNPGTNAEEHHDLRQWLADTGLAADTGDFEALHLADTGRELRVWYEISGRRVNGVMTRGTSTRSEARFDSLFHATDDGWKIHHARELLYHRESLELVDTLLDVTRDEEPRALRSYQCGCYGWAIGADWATLGGDYIYHVEVEWLHHRVGAGLFVGLERRPRFPWVGLADRARLARLARRAKTYRLTDARNQLFAEVAITLSSDPPTDGLGVASYQVRLTDPHGNVEPLARIEYTPNEVAVHLSPPRVAAGARTGDRPDWELAVERLDALLAAMPTQVLRGDGVRDSHLGKIETVLDWIRWTRDPGEDRLADVISEIDALTAVSKVHALLEVDSARFRATKKDYFPLPPRRHLDSPYNP